METEATSGASVEKVTLGLGIADPNASSTCTVRGCTPPGWSATLVGVTWMAVGTWSTTTGTSTASRSGAKTVMVAVPFCRAVTKPKASTVATLPLLVV
jgi:hypothetical protein